MAKSNDEEARIWAAKELIDTAMEDRSDPMRRNLMRVAYFLRPSDPSKMEKAFEIVKEMMPEKTRDQFLTEVRDVQREATIKDLEIGENFLTYRIHLYEAQIEMAKRAIRIVNMAKRSAVRAETPEEPAK